MSNWDFLVSDQTPPPCQIFPSNYCINMSSQKISGIFQKCIFKNHRMLQNEECCNIHEVHEVHEGGVLMDLYKSLITLQPPSRENILYIYYYLYFQYWNPGIEVDYTRERLPNSIIMVLKEVYKTNQNLVFLINGGKCKWNVCQWGTNLQQPFKYYLQNYKFPYNPLV